VGASTACQKHAICSDDQKKKDKEECGGVGENLKQIETNNNNNE
jgi:hypothetical protein